MRQTEHHQSAGFGEAMRGIPDCNFIALYEYVLLSLIYRKTCLIIHSQ